MRMALFGSVLLLTLGLSPAVHGQGATPATAPGSRPAAAADGKPTFISDKPVVSWWKPLEFLIGDWEGFGNGAPGTSTGDFSFATEVDGHVLVRHSESNSPSGSHRDLMVIHRAPDGSLRAVYFDNEDHVINYAVTTAENPGTAVFLSDAVGGAPRFRLTYREKPDGTIGIAFDIAPPGSEEFKTYVEGFGRKRTH